MNQINIIGNLTADPVTRTTQSGVSCATFTVAVNRRGKNAEGADFFRVTAWRELGDICAKYLAKGRKVAVTGSASISLYTDRNGNPAGSIEVNAQNVEFLSSRADTQQETPYAQPTTALPASSAISSAPAQSDFVQVDDEDLPF